MIFVAGSANLDFVVRASHIPVAGETVLGREFRTFPGGKGANQALACARAGGVATQMLLALGDDPFALPIETSLKCAGVRLHVILVADQPTGTAFICVSDQGTNAITVAPGANSHLREEHLPSLEGVAYLLLQLEIPIETVAAYARRAHEQGVKVMLNAAPARILSAELLSLLDVLVVNEFELGSLTNNHDTIAQRISGLDVGSVVVTLGERGSVACVNGEFFVQSAYSVDAIDTTAAGDTFCGVLAASLSRNLSMQDALMYASAASALACTQLGAQQSVPQQENVHNFLRRQPASSDALNCSLRQFCGLPD